MAAKSRKSAQRSRARFIVRPLFAALVASGVVVPAQGATIVVSDGGDAGTGSTCTLRQAIASLNGGVVVDGCLNTGAGFGSGDNVDLSGRTGTIALAGAAPLPINVSMSIQGPGPAALTLSGGGASQVFRVAGSANEFDLSGVTVANGKSKGPGGCIYAQAPSGVFLSNAVITGCSATDDPNLGPIPFNGIGGGVFAYALFADGTTISGNTAKAAGGGVAAAIVEMNQTLVTGNTVLGETIDVANYTASKYLFSAAVGGGGIVSGRFAYLTYSVVSNNTVNATRFTGIAEGGNNYEYRFGNGGGITHIGFKYSNPALAPAGKSTIAGARPPLSQLPSAKVAEFRARAAALRTSPVAKVAALKPKWVEPYGGLNVFSSTISGNRIQGGGSPGNALIAAKYGGGGAAFFATDYTSRFSNSTISGNLLPAGGTCTPPSGPPSGNFFKATCGAGLAGDSANVFNSTITGNLGATAVQFKYGLTTPTLAPMSLKSALLDSHPRLRDALLRAQPTPVSATKARTKAATSSVLVSTIVGANNGTYDIGCLDSCTLGGASDLVRTAQSTVTLPLGTIGSDPQLAPLANRGGVSAGAPGILGTGPTPTHALYVGSPAIDAGENPNAYTFDERGSGFPRTVGPQTDIGAFEGAVKRPAVNSVPALGPWMLGALSGLLGALGLWRRRRRA